MPDRPPSGPSDYLAAERTFLAWIRTGLALMGFGFVVARFGLFLQAMQIGQPSLLTRPYGPSFWFGTALIVLGVIVNLMCAWTHVRLVQELKRGGSGFAQPSSLAIAVAILLAALGIAMAIYLVSVHAPKQAHLGLVEKRGLTTLSQTQAVDSLGCGSRGQIRLSPFFNIHLERVQEKSMTSHPDNGFVAIPGHQSVDQTVQKLEAILQAKGVKLFAVVDHSGEAEKAGMHMPNTKLLIFGNPKAGTPLMMASPSIAIDLPLKILVWEDAGGKVWVSYNSPAYLQARHGLPAELIQNISVVEALAAKAAQ